MTHIPYYNQREYSMQSTVEHNKFTDEYFITLPDKIIESLQLVPGDVLEWAIVDGQVFVSKK